MSVGDFEWTRYRSVKEPSNIYRIRCQRETFLLKIEGAINSPPLTQVNKEEIIKIGKGTREFGRGPFLVKLRWQSSAPPGYDSCGDLWVPLLDSGIRDRIGKGATGIYLGRAVDVRGTRPEMY